MAFSVDTKIATGTNNIFTFTFSGLGRGYLDPSHIHVFIDGVEQTFVLDGTNQLIVDGPVIPSGTEVVIRRITPKPVPVVDWKDLGYVRADLLDRQDEQLLYISHEFLDGYGLEAVNVDIDMQGHRLLNVYTDLDDPASLATIGALGTYRDEAASSAAAALASAGSSEAASSAAGAASSAADAARAAAVTAQLAAEAARDSNIAALAPLEEDIMSLQAEDIVHASALSSHEKRGKFSRLDVGGGGTQALAASTNVQVATTGAVEGTLGAAKSGTVLGLVVPETGWYSVVAQVAITATSGATGINLRLFLNGSQNRQRIGTATAGQWITITLQHSAQFVAGDVLDVRVFGAAAGSILSTDGCLVLTRLT